MLWVIAAPLAIATALGLAFGAAAVAFFVVQAAVAVTLLEQVNYLEHYGLVRRRRADGRYETVTPRHSWNSSQRLSNWFLFNLQRHSHHHAQVTRHYQELLHVADAPQLPTGYAGMIVVALLPPLWRRIMDPRLLAWRAQAADGTP
jgi:alkane 1-monooxygenase